MQSPFVYDGRIVAALRSSISAERLSRYEGMASGDLAHALRLYMWNTALSEALYSPIQGLEVTLRNKIHEHFAVRFGACWYDMSNVGLAHSQQSQVLTAKRSLQQQGKVPDPSRLVAALSFGFWVGLFGPKYETHLWRPHLRPLFINVQSPFLRKDAHRVLNDIRLLRNRIARHEPILHRSLQQDHAFVLMAIRWLCEATASWIDHHSRFREVWAERP